MTEERHSVNNRTHAFDTGQVFRRLRRRVLPLAGRFQSITRHRLLLFFAHRAFNIQRSVKYVGGHNFVRPGVCGDHLRAQGCAACAALMSVTCCSTSHLAFGVGFLRGATVGVHRSHFQEHCICWRFDHRICPFSRTIHWGCLVVRAFRPTMDQLQHSDYRLSS